MLHIASYSYMHQFIYSLMSPLDALSHSGIITLPPLSVKFVPASLSLRSSTKLGSYKYMSIHYYS